jgi:hypothetical protein
LSWIEHLLPSVYRNGAVGQEVRHSMWTVQRCSVLKPMTPRWINLHGIIVMATTLASTTA